MFYQHLGPGCISATNSHLAYLECADKRCRHTVVQYQFAFLAQLLGTTISLLEKNTLIYTLSPCPKLQGLVPSLTTQLEQWPQAPALPESSHICQVFLSPKHGAPHFPPSLLAACLQGSGSFTYPFCPAFFTDRSITNCGTGP